MMVLTLVYLTEDYNSWKLGLGVSGDGRSEEKYP